MNFNFLNNITINKVEENAQATKSTGRKAQEKNPTNGASLRLFKDGSIYPSKELVEQFNLEYTKDKSGNGFDVFPSTSWNQYPKDAENVVFISAVSKENARVDLFSQAREVNGELTSVLNQGSKTFGLELIPMLAQTYNKSIEGGGLALFGDKKYVDLQVVSEVALTQDIVYVPKMITKGEHKGTMTTERRENVTLMPLAIYNGGGTADSLTENPANEMLEVVQEEELV